MIRILLLALLLIVGGVGFAGCQNRTGNGNLSSTENETERPFPVPGISFDPHHYIVYRADEPLLIDGKLDEEVWANTAWTQDFVDIEGDLKPLPRFRTRAKMLWDEDYFYFAAELEEPHVWATLTERNSVIFRDNDFEIFIDPNGDTHNYWEFELNAIETIWDLFLTKPYRDGNVHLNNWNMFDVKVGVYVDGTVNDPRDKDEKWTLEVALPWEALKETAPGRRKPNPGEQWRVNFSRVQYYVDIVDNQYRKRTDPDTGDPLPEDNWVWSPQGVINMHYPEMWGFAQFSDRTAGSGEERFVWNREEEIKWALRQVYYRQKNYRRRHGNYTDDPAQLNLGEIGVEGFDFNPDVATTMSLFEATSPGFDSDLTWHIRSDGRVWSE